MADEDLKTSGAISVGSWDWDVVADRVTADPAFARLYGVDAAAARAGAPIDRFFAAMHPDDAPDRKSTRLNSSHIQKSRMPSSA